MARFGFTLIVQFLMMVGIATALVPFQPTSSRFQAVTPCLFLCPEDADQLVAAFNEALETHDTNSSEITNEPLVQGKGEAAMPIRTNVGIVKRIRTFLVSKLGRA